MKSVVCFFSVAVSLVACSSPTTDQTAAAEDTAVVASQSVVEDGWQPLFNHNNLDGWDTLPGGEWKVEEGITWVPARPVTPGTAY